MGVLAVGGGAEEREEESGGWGVTCEGLLPRAGVRVLLVEADDSTSRIIAALLRKYGYIVVAAVADGLKAWEILKENSQNIDLVLAEVDPPSLSGYGLLTMTMEHEASKNTPVIMMSSRDSINMVSKCIFKGAADFLVKPIRKNELRNLWQHVWRRHSSDGITRGIHMQQYETFTQQKDETKSENNSVSNYSRDHISSLKKNRWCSEKECDTQHSYATPGMEAESKCIQNMPENIQPDFVSSSVISGIRNCKDDACDKWMRRYLCMAVKLKVEEKDQWYCQREPRKEVDLLVAMDNRSWCNQELRGCCEVQDETLRDAEFSGDARDQNWCPSLELSSEKYQPINTDNHEKDEFNLLNHSSSSPFSRYYKIKTSSLSTFNGFIRTVPEDDVYEQPREKGPPQNKTLQCNGAQLHPSPEYGDSTTDGQLNHNGRVACSHVGLLPNSVPMIGAANSGLFSGCIPATQPLFYTQSVIPVWSPKATSQEATKSTLSHQSDQESFNAGQHHHSHRQNVHKQLPQQMQENICNVETSKEKSHASSVTGQSRGGGILSGSTSHINSRACGGVCDSGSGNLTSSNTSRSTVESTEGNGFFTHDGIKLAESHHSAKREAALHKFRLKRKERCFEKKVRYQSRKRLAEERPRVKGQFVRKVQCDPRPSKEDSFALQVCI